MKSTVISLSGLITILSVSCHFCCGFTSNPLLRQSRLTSASFFKLHESTKGFGSYVPQKEDQPETKVAKPVYPKAGDIVRYFDIDGGKSDGQWFIGKISFIQKNVGGEASGWTLDIAELEDLGEGFFAEYPARTRASKRTTRDLAAVNPVAASFVRAENAFKVPRDPATGIPRARRDRYDIDGYQGPFSGMDAINQSVVEQDAEIYAALKSKLLRYAALAGLAGTLIADLTKGTEDAIIYGAGAFFSLIYLFLLSIKTDTIASEKQGLGKNISSFRFALPILLIVAIGWYNTNLGDANPVNGKGLLDFVTPEQFAAAVLGFLTYRIPLFLTQIQDALKDAGGANEGAVVLPGSAGIAMQLAREAKASDADTAKTSLANDDLATVLLVSGPQATGRPELVKRLIAEGNGKFRAPKPIDKMVDPANFDRLLQRDEILALDKTERFAITKERIIETARAASPDSVVVVDADVALAKKLTNISGLRLISVWVGLRSLDSFQERLSTLEIPDDETRESVTRARIREIVQEIEYGLSSGIFEFTIFNEDEDDSIKQLLQAAEYCYR
jgi:guanylate kinase